MSKHQPYSQLWRQWTTQRRLGAAAALSLTVSLLCLPWAITKGRSLDKLLVICVGLVSTEAARRSAFGYFDHRDSDADLVFAEKRELIQQHIQVLRDDELVQPELAPANDNSNEDEMITNVVDYWKQQEKHLLVIGGTGAGKALDVNERVFTKDGQKTIADLAVGELIHTPTGFKPVLAKSQVWTNEPTYRVTFDDNTFVDCSGNHLWTVQRVGGAGKVTSVTKSTEELLADGVYRCGRKRFSIPCIDAIERKEQELPIDPYVFGLWLGDGHTNSGAITTADDFVWQEIQKHYVVTKRSGITYGILGLQTQLRALGVLGNKHIPEIYKLASVEQRMELIRGLFDSDGCWSRTQVEYCSKLEVLANGVAEVCRSLGWKTWVRANAAKLYGKDCGVRYRVFVYPSRYDVFKLERKLAKVVTTTLARARRHYIRSIETIETKPTQCIQVEGGLFTCASYKTTHNSTFIKSFSKRLSGFQTKVYDCDATVDDWDWANIVYHEFEDISQHMTDDLALIPEIRKQRYKDGKSWQAEPTLMIADEFPALVAELSVAKKWLSTHAKQTRKHKRMIAILSQNDTVANLGLKGDISVRDTCFTLVYLGKKAEERAKALEREDWVNVLRQEPYKYAIVDDKLAVRP